jgi:hypothetical protein
MSSVAYPAQPTGPGWWRTAWLMVLGWFAAAVVLGGLYLAGTLAGAIGRNSYAGAGLGVHAINDWPFASNGRWSLLADVSVFALALGVTTIAIAWQLRGPFATVSEGRLLVVLFFTGGAPFVTSEDSAPVLFVIAVWVVRAWVVKDELRFPRIPLLVVAAALVLTIASYGLFHPVWVESATATSSMSKSKRPTILLTLRNASRTGIRLEEISAGGFTPARAGWPWQLGTPLPVRIPGGHTEAFMLRMKSGTCGNGFIANARYRVFGRTLHQPFTLTVSGLRGC